MRRRIRVIGLTLFVACSGCASPVESRLTELSPAPPQAAFDRTSGPVALPRVPHSLRPCCIFGYGVGVQLVGVPLPGVRIDNVASLDELGEHTYDGGALSDENNGVTYTCRGGFIDTAHVRDYADWTFFLSHHIVAMLDHGGRIELPREGGRRIVYVAAMDPDLVDAVGTWNLAVTLAEWLAFQLSIWHETATWYGWSTLSAFPEFASAFSPEDLYSNLSGIKLAGAILRDVGPLSEDQFNESMTRALSHFLSGLGVVSPDVTRLAAASIDRARGARDGWWDSSRRVPDKSLLLRRYLDVGSRIAPWQVPPRERSPGLLDALDHRCGRGGEQPLVLDFPRRTGGSDISSLVRLDIQVDERIGAIFPLKTSAMRWIGQNDLIEVIEQVRQRVLAEFGEGSDAP